MDEEDVVSVWVRWVEFSFVGFGEREVDVAFFVVMRHGGEKK